MSKIQLDIFNSDMYRQLINTYNNYLNGLKKYISINSKLYGYFEKDEIAYIVDVYCNLLNDLVNSNLFSLFVPKNALNKIKKELIPIKILKQSKNYERIIYKFEKIREMITIEELL